jgi:hypothetical protein
LSLNCCPYRAMSVFQRPLRFGSYPGGNFFDTGGPLGGNALYLLFKVGYQKIL